MSKPKVSKSTKPSTKLKQARAARASESSEEIIPDYVESLRTTLEHFPPYDLRSREDFKNDEELKNIAGRTFKKVVTGLLDGGNKFLLKKNGREAARDSDGKKTPSRDMNLKENHEESFREICALRLFQLIFQEPEVAPNMKLVISDFDQARSRNARKQDMHKVYVASEEVPGSQFNVTRLSVLNNEILTKKDEAGAFANQQIIDKLCEQMVVMALLSNPDAIKFDNFLIDEKGGVVTQLDFGDARHNEYSNPDPICMLDVIRKYVDGNSTRSTRDTFFEENLPYQMSLRFFNEHISPAHILAVIEKLKTQSEKICGKLPMFTATEAS